MAAERTPSRRKQCIFRRTFQRFPFRKCERRSNNSSSSSSSSSSYDIHHGEKSPYTAEKWSPADSAISTIGIHQPRHVDSGGSRRTEPPNVAPSKSFNGMCEDIAEPTLGIHHVSNHHVSNHHVSNHHVSNHQLPHHSYFPPHHHMDSAQIPPDTEGHEDVDSAYYSVSCTNDTASPPSPGISSMDTDVGVDPETGERAME